MKRLVAALGCLFVCLTAGHANEPTLSFNRDIRPILSDACFHCHGPDTNKRKSGLRLDTEAGHDALAPGRVAESEVMRRITSNDPKTRMPPPGAGSALTGDQVRVIQRWIEEGAKYEKHWAFIAPTRTNLPAVRDTSWPKQPLDHWVLARLEKEGLKPSPPADPATLLRRVSLDLTGLPPTPEETAAFVADPSDLAYERVVDRLLRSPRFGERMASRWLDAARYADTNGYQTDGERTMWRWRDWVIEAFNSNMPFDRFTIEQLAGDMLPEASLDQKIATGFNRNHRGNSEGGVIPEEYAVEYVVDRVDTTATVWLGLTMGCCRCHNHKYDPFTQREFYQLFAYFNNVPERGKAIKYGNSPPYIKAPTREQQKEGILLRDHLRIAESRWAGLQARVEHDQQRWESTDGAKASADWSFTRNQNARFPLEDAAPPHTKHGSPASCTGKIGAGQLFDGKSFLGVGDVGDFGFFDKFTLTAWVQPASSQAGSIFSRMTDVDRGDGYHVFIQNGKIHVHLIKRWLDDAIRVESKAAIEPGRWHHLAVSYDGSRLASGVCISIDGQPVPLTVHLDDLNQSFQTKEPFRIGAGGGQRFCGAIDEVRIFSAVVAPEDVASLALADTVPTLLLKMPSKRTAAERHKIRSCFLELHASPELQQAYQAVLKSQHDVVRWDESLPTSMVMEEMTTPRPTHLLLRGEYDKKGERVYPALPAGLPALASGSPNNRLGFARWLMQPDHPLTARVAVNRFWQMLFGAGLVRSVEDFGAQGDWPSHLELLDTLALEFRDSGWNIHHLLKSIVTSATYRQSSKASALASQRDPENRLLSRGARYRLSADVIRDQALAVSGLLVEKVGGPSVRPYQPVGLVKELHGTEDYVQDHGPNLYRRSLYTFWKRTVAPPTLMAFDAANRETCVVRETRTNTPLQALNLLNDVTFVEAARALAQRVMSEAPKLEARLQREFALVLGRTPRAEELAVLRRAWQHHRSSFRDHPAAADKLLRVGEHPVDPRHDRADLAAFTAIANLLLNLDEAITKE